MNSTCISQEIALKDSSFHLGVFLLWREGPTFSREALVTAGIHSIVMNVVSNEDFVDSRVFSGDMSPVESELHLIQNVTVFNC